MIIELTKEEIEVLKPIIDHNIAWLRYKTEHREIKYDDKMIQELEILTLLKGKLL